MFLDFLIVMLCCFAGDVLHVLLTDFGRFVF